MLGGMGMPPLPSRRTCLLCLLALQAAPNLRCWPRFQAAPQVDIIIIIHEGRIGRRAPINWRAALPRVSNRVPRLMPPIIGLPAIHNN